MAFLFSPCSPCSCATGNPRIGFNYCNNVLASGNLILDGSGYHYSGILDASGSYIASGIFNNRCYSGILSTAQYGNFTTAFCIPSGVMKNFNVVYSQSDQYSCCFPCSLPKTSGLYLDITGPFGQDYNYDYDGSNGNLTILQSQHNNFLDSLSGVFLRYVGSGSFVEQGVSFSAPYYISDPTEVGTTTSSSTNIEDDPPSIQIYQSSPGCSGFVSVSHYYKSDITNNSATNYLKFVYSCGISGVPVLVALYENDSDNTAHSTLLTWTHEDFNNCDNPPHDVIDTYQGYDNYTETKSSGIVPAGYNVDLQIASSYCNPYDVTFTHNGLWLGGGGGAGVASVYER